VKNWVISEIYVPSGSPDSSSVGATGDTVCESTMSWKKKPIIYDYKEKKILCRYLPPRHLVEHSSRVLKLFEFGLASSPTKFFAFTRFRVEIKTWNCGSTWATKFWLTTLRVCWCLSCKIFRIIRIIGSLSCSCKKNIIWNL
jgi:hypothetical protein